MSDVVVTVVESNTNVTVTEQDVAVAVTETTVEVSAATAGIQGNPGANNDPVYVTVRNATGALITKGSIVYVSGGNGTHTQVTKAIASGDSTSARTLGWLADDIANNADGLCMVEGYLDGVNTQGVTEGVQLYLSGTVAGAYQVAKPVAPIHLVYVGVCVKASAGNGRVYVKVQNGYELSEIHDVLIVSPTNNQVLAYDSATQLWKNATNAPDGVTSITATAPLTGGTITSTGSIGLDQTALSLTRSQITDFASGTVTSASTAQQSGTAVFATNASTAVFATTAGTATTISGSITKSQVSDFTSGTVASASTAQQSGTAVFADTSGTATYATTSGTAVFATNASTAVNLSGSITKSQVSDFTSGTVTSASTAQQSGTAVYSVNSGTATYATTSGTATYADTSGTAVFATNASTAVTISGSIAQSQVTNLTTDLAGKANLAGGNAFTGNQTIVASGTTDRPLIIKGFSGQTANLLEARSSADVLMTRIDRNGAVSATYWGPVGTGLTGYLEWITSTPTFYSGAAATVGMIVRGFSGQSSDLFQVQNNGSANLAVISSTGTFRTAGLITAGNVTDVLGQLSVYTTAASRIGAVIRGAASQTANLQEWQDSAGNILSRVASDGSIIYGRYSGSGFSTNTGSASIITNNSAVIPLTVKGAASQTANLQEWQNSAGTVLASVLNGGGIRAPFYQVGSSGVVTLATANSGGQIYMAKQTAQATSPGAGNAHLYFRDGTTAGTLKLVVRAGAAGAETTILDNIPQ